MIQPIISAVNDPAPPWSIGFAIIYEDAMYIKITEHYRQLAKREGGGGRLQFMSYHYGACGDERDDDGFPYKEDQCALRIDIDKRSLRHAHWNGEDHIPEHRLMGLDFEAITPSVFIRAVEEHRATGRPLPEILGFEVRAAR